MGRLQASGTQRCAWVKMCRLLCFLKLMFLTLLLANGIVVQNPISDPGMR